jgi:hypothetical protein
MATLKVPVSPEHVSYEEPDETVVEADDPEEEFSPDRAHDFLAAGAVPVNGRKVTAGVRIGQPPEQGHAGKRAGPPAGSIPRSAPQHGGELEQRASQPQDRD